jgi:hypothetical protein
MMTKAAWTAPTLEQLSVDLEAIAAKTKPGNDSPGIPASKS